MRTWAHVAWPGQSARGLAQSKTLARMTMAYVNAKQSWTAVALHRFSQKTCLPPPNIF
jgi:hypothetical protein